MFKGEYLQKQKDDQFKKQLIAASFTAWQMMVAQGIIKKSWKSYLKTLDLVEEVKISKEQLEKEAERAMNNVQRIIQRAASGKRAI